MIFLEENDDHVFNPMDMAMNLKELSIDNLIKYCMLQALRLQTEDVIKFSLAVENLESLLWDEIEKDTEYQDNIKKKKAEINKEHGSGEDKKILVMKEISQYKFRLLVNKVKKKIPIDTIGVI